MVWNKTKQQLEGFLTPSLVGIVDYKASAYKYRADKSGNCYITVRKKEVLNVKDASASIDWYQTEQEIKGADALRIHVTKEDIEVVRQKSGGKIPEDRLELIAQRYKLSQYAKDVLEAQSNLYQSDFQKTANLFLTTSIDKCLESDDIILNILAIIDRRVGKKRLENLDFKMQMKHSAVQYFYHLRLGK